MKSNDTIKTVLKALVIWMIMLCPHKSWALDPTPNSPPPDVTRSIVHFETCRPDASMSFGFQFNPSSANPQQILPGSTITAQFPRDGFDPDDSTDPNQTTLDLIQNSTMPEVIFHLVATSPLFTVDAKEWAFEFTAPGFLEIRRHYDRNYFAHLSITSSLGRMDYCALVRFEVHSTDTNPTVSVGNGIDQADPNQIYGSPSDDDGIKGCGALKSESEDSSVPLKLVTSLLATIATLFALRRRSCLYERK